MKNNIGNWDNIKGREKLSKYFSTGNHVFHGTDNANIKIFEPRQSYNYIDGNKIKDGAPAVFASIDIEIPIFFALFNHNNIPLEHISFGVGEEEGIIDLRATKKAIDYFQKHEIIGYVYVFEKENFDERNNDSTGLVCEENVKPVDVVEVTNNDIILPIQEI